MTQVDFYFDFINPYVWLASHQLGEVRACTAAKFRFVPVLSAALLDHNLNLGPAEIPAKRRYTFQDAERATSAPAYANQLAGFRAGLRALG